MTETDVGVNGLFGLVAFAASQKCSLEEESVVLAVISSGTRELAGLLSTRGIETMPMRMLAIALTELVTTPRILNDAQTLAAIEQAALAWPDAPVAQAIVENAIAEDVMQS